MAKKPWPWEVYRRIKVGDLILASLYLLGDEKEITFEKLLIQAFQAFPQKFNFNIQTKWPDSRKLDRPLRSLRERKMIRGSSQATISLTNLGRKRALEIMNLFRQKKLEI